MMMMTMMGVKMMDDGPLLSHPRAQPSLIGCPKKVLAPVNRSAGCYYP
jgi:hypothetical protein